MLHLRYFRPERSRVDSCVLMLPDTSSVPAFQISEEQYQQAELTLQNQLAAKLSAIDEEEFVPPNSEKANEKGSNELCDGAAAENTVTPTEAGAGGEDQQGKNAEAATELPQIQAPSATESTETAAEVLSHKKVPNMCLLDHRVPRTVAEGSFSVYSNCLNSSFRQFKISFLCHFFHKSYFYEINSQKSILIF